MYANLRDSVKEPDRRETLLDLKQQVAHLATLPDPLFLDTETSNLEGEVIEIAVLDARGTVLISSLVHPREPIDPRATRIHGITDAMVADAPEWVELYEPVRGIVHARHLIAFNAAYDMKRVAHSSSLCGRPGLGCCWHDVMIPASILFGEWDGSHGNWRYQKLAGLCRWAGLELSEFHRAIPDAEACRRLWQWLPGGVAKSLAQLRERREVRR